MATGHVHRLAGLAARPEFGRLECIEEAVFFAGSADPPAGDLELHLLVVRYPNFLKQISTNSIKEKTISDWGHIKQKQSKYFIDPKLNQI